MAELKQKDLIIREGFKHTGVRNRPSHEPPVRGYWLAVIDTTDKGRNTIWHMWYPTAISAYHDSINFLLREAKNLPLIHVEQEIPDINYKPVPGVLFKRTVQVSTRTGVCRLLIADDYTVKGNNACHTRVHHHKPYSDPKKAYQQAVFFLLDEAERLDFKTINK